MLLKGLRVCTDNFYHVFPLRTLSFFGIMSATAPTVCMIHSVRFIIVNEYACKLGVVFVIFNTSFAL